MTIREEYRDLFTVPTDYVLVHCISADFTMGAGIAREFAKRGVKKYLQTSEFALNTCESERVGVCYTTFKTEWKAVFNLITKQKYWQKPTYKSLQTALNEASKLCGAMESYGCTMKLAIPRIGCGLDRLEWAKVKKIIKATFANTDVEILVCIK